MTEVKREEIGDAPPIRGPILSAFALMIGGPAAFLTALGVRYSLVGPACEITAARVALELSTLIGLAAAGAAVWLGLKRLSIGSPEDLIDQHDQPRFIAAFGLLAGALSLLAGLALWLPSLFLSPCGRP